MSSIFRSQFVKLDRQQFLLGLRGGFSKSVVTEVVNHLCQISGYIENLIFLTHLPRVLHICVKYISIGSDNGLSPVQHQAIIWTNAGLLPIRPLGINFYQTSKLFIHENTSENVACKMAAILSREGWVNLSLFQGLGGVSITPMSS